MSWDDLARRARNQAPGRPAPIGPGGGHPVLILRIFDDGHMPTTTPGQFAGHPARYGGVLDANAAFTPVVDTTRKQVVTVYGTVPAVGDYVLAERRGGKWVAVNWPGDAKIIDPPGTCPVIVKLQGCPGVGIPGVGLGLGAASLQGGTVTIDGVTKVANSDSETAWTLDPGTYTATTTATGYAPATQTFTIGEDCNTVYPARIIVPMTPDGSHVCCPPCENRIAKKPWYITDSNGTWAFTNPGGGCASVAIGTATKEVLVLSWMTCSEGDPFGLGFRDCSILVAHKTTSAITYRYNLILVGGRYFGLIGGSLNPVLDALDEDAVDCETEPAPYTGFCPRIQAYGPLDLPDPPHVQCTQLPLSQCDEVGGASPWFNAYGIFGNCDVDGASISGHFDWQGPMPSDGYPTDGHFEIGT